MVTSDVIPLKCFTLNRTQHPRFGKCGSTHGGLGDPRCALAAGFTAGAGGFHMQGCPHSPEDLLLYFVL